MTDHRESIPRFPLEWPAGWVRTPRHRRTRANFRSYKQALTMAIASGRLQQQLELLGVRGTMTLSTNVELRIDGLPRSGQGQPTDPGASLWFVYKGKATVLACDKWDRVEDNVAALAAHIDAIRRVDRYGVGSIEQALAGYKALPADTAADWRAVFGYGPSTGVDTQDLNTRFKVLAREKHPDVLHDDGAAMAHLNRARDYALAELETR